MRRRALLREPASQSQCIFCTYRLASTYYTHRRPFHSSRAVSKPPGAATAPQKPHDDDDGAYNPTGSASPQAKDGSSTFGSATTASFGRPTFGVKPAFAAAAPNFGSKPTFGAGGSSFGLNKPTFGAGGSGFDAKPAFGGGAPTFGRIPSSDVKHTERIEQKTTSTSSGTPSSEIKPTFGGRQRDGGKASSFDKPNFDTNRISGRGEKEGRGKPDLGRNASFSVRPTDGTGRETGSSSGSNPSSDIRPAIGRGAASRPLNNIRPELKPVLGGGHREEGGTPSFDNHSFGAKSISRGGEREGQTTPHFGSSPNFSAKSTSRGGEREGQTTPHFGSSPNFGAKSTFRGEGQTTPSFGTSPSFGVKPADGKEQVTPSSLGSRPSFDMKPSFGREIPSSLATNPGPEPSNVEDGSVAPDHKSTIGGSNVKPVSGTDGGGATSYGSISSSSSKPATTGDKHTSPSSDKPVSGAVGAKGNAASIPGNNPDFGSKPTFGGIGAAPAFGGNMKFGSKPTFGSGATATPSFGNNTSFGTKPIFGGLSSSTGSQSANVSSEERNFREAQEREARERILRLAGLDDTKRTPVNVFGGAGPESTRAGRPLPYSENELQAGRISSKLSPFENAGRTIQEQKNGSQGRNEVGTANNDSNFANSKPRFGSPGPSLGTEFKTTRIEPLPLDREDLENRTYDRSENWAHLKKQQQESSSTRDQAQERDDSAFVIARAEREREATARRYVPLASRPTQNPRQDEDQKWSRTSIRDTYGRTMDHREEQRQARYPRLDAYGQTVASHIQPGPKVYDPYAPLGKSSTPISPGEWRNEPPQRDDRLRRIYRDDSDYRNSSNPRYTDDRNARYDTASRTGGSYGFDSRLQPPRDPQYSRRWDENDESRGTSRRTFSEYEMSTPSEDLQRSQYTPRGYENSRPAEGPNQSESSFRGGYEIPNSEEDPRSRDRYEISRVEDSRSRGRYASSNSEDPRSKGRYGMSRPSEDTRRSENISRSSYENFSLPEESRAVASTRDSQRPRSRYEELPKGKERDKARRREQFVDSFDEVEDEAAARAELKRKRKAEKAAKKAAALTPILLPEWISVTNLATALKVRLEDFSDKLVDLGYEGLSHDHVLGAEDAGLIAQEYGFEPIIDRNHDEDDLKSRPPAEDVSLLPPRPPVVTIMGHVDHGKTTLLDWMRKSSVAASEHGGITQHIGAFSVPMPSGKVITFLDTPGHEAFLNMRQRGANVTDIVILVVAADDSVKPQTIEAINHGRAAKVPMIVAISKIDRPESNIERVKQDLARHSVDIEDIGGDTQVVCVSGLTGQGMEDLEEAVVTLSEILDMRAETDGPAEGWVIEASLKSMGKVATVLVKRGTMRVGDFIVAGKTWARIRCMRNEAGTEIEEAGPGTPVEIDGWREQPLAGDEVLQASDEGRAKRAVEYRLEKEEREKMAADMEAINVSRKADQEKREREKREAAIAAGILPEEEMPEEEAEPSAPGIKEVFFIIKADVSGSVEAVTDSINAIGTKEIRAKILQARVGQLTESDVEYAAVAKGILINFNTDVDPNISGLAAKSNVPILDHNIIYRLVDDVKAKLSEQLPPVITQSVTGEAEVSKIFDITIKGRKQKPIAGCKVRNGIINRASKVKVMRNGEKVFDGTFASLKNVKKDVLEMRKGTECGIGFENWTDFKVGDLIQCYDVIETKRYL